MMSLCCAMLLEMCYDLLDISQPFIVYLVKNSNGSHSSQIVRFIFGSIETTWSVYSLQMDTYFSYVHIFFNGDDSPILYQYIKQRFRITSNNKVRIYVRHASTYMCFSHQKKKKNTVYSGYLCDRWWWKCEKKNQYKCSPFTSKSF